MTEENNIVGVAKYNPEYNELLGVDIELTDIFRSNGLTTHVERRHANCLKYIESLPDIINNPDYVGVNPNENGTSVEYVKKYSDDNAMVGVKVDINNDYLYVATIYEISNSKIERRLHSGRLKVPRHTVSLT